MLNLATHKYWSKKAQTKAMLTRRLTTFALAIVSLLAGCQTPGGTSGRGDGGTGGLGDQETSRPSPSLPVSESPSLPVSESPSLPVTPSPSPEVSQSPGPPVTPSPSLPVSPSPSLRVPQSPSLPVSPSPSLPVSQSPSQPITIMPPTEGCKITMAIVSDPNPPLNVRSAPMVAEGNIVGKVNNGTYLTVMEEQNGWLRIDEPAGWISKQNTQTSCSQVTERINFAPNGNSAIIKGQIIGPGSHKYLLAATAGQTIKVIKLNPEGVFPAIIDPDGNILAGNPYTDADRNEWTGTLPVTGDYSLQMDSNFRGFDYQFSVEIN